MRKLRLSAALLLAGILTFSAGCGAVDSIMAGIGLTDSSKEVIAPSENAAGFYYDMLDEESRTLYARILTAVEEGLYEFNVEASDDSPFDDIYNAFLADHPEFFYLDGSATLKGLEGGSFKTVSLGLNIAEEDIPEKRTEIEAIRNDFYSELSDDMTTYQMVRKAYEYIIGNTDYVLNADQSQNIQSVFLNHRSVCAGYARAFKYLLDGIRIPCAYVSGSSTGGSSHAWNYVEIDGVGTYVDVTFGDPTYLENEDVFSVEMEAAPSVNYDFLCLAKEEILRLHTFADSSFQPECSDRSFDYYILNSAYYGSFDGQVLRNLFTDAVNEGKHSIMMKYADQEAYQSALSSIREGSIANEAFQQQMEWDGTESMSYYYNSNDYLYTLSVYW